MDILEGILGSESYPDNADLDIESPRETPSASTFQLDTDDQSHDVSCTDAKSVGYFGFQLESVEAIPELEEQKIIKAEPLFIKVIEDCLKEGNEACVMFWIGKFKGVFGFGAVCSTSESEISFKHLRLSPRCCWTDFGEKFIRIRGWQVRKFRIKVDEFLIKRICITGPRCCVGHKSSRIHGITSRR